ncbi:hypothetical protein [Vagococcus salmoninarum]|uniref:hypothetical protein n=1 Tax=Vagococcus salmoninarum TaxID=2739 RepID=UPI0028D1A4E5|nr:hypothetical protein [Vagococcus salmoninarum]
MKHLLVSFSFITFFWLLVPVTVQATAVNVPDKANLVLGQTDNHELSLWIEPSEYANFAYTFANSTYLIKKTNNFHFKLVNVSPIELPIQRATNTFSKKINANSSWTGNYSSTKGNVISLKAAGVTGKKRVRILREGSLIQESTSEYDVSITGSASKTAQYTFAVFNLTSSAKTWDITVKY